MNKKYVYHLLPETMQGTVLYPLNQLKNRHPDIASEHSEKYNWRLDIMKRKIPILNALWNDVLHFSILNPQKTFQYLQTLRGPFGRKRRIIQIPVELMEAKRCVYFQPSGNPRKNISEVLSEEVQPFFIQDYAEQMAVSEEQKNEWKKNLKANEPLLLFSKTTHLLCHGELDIQGLDIETIET